MKLERLEVSGFLHFARPTTLDLRDVPSGLVAVVGANGNGKTLLLDAALSSLYGPGAVTQAFPSRDGTLAEYATSRSAYLDATWEVEGDGTFRARANVDGERRLTQAVLEQRLPNGFWRPLNDGKTSTFRDAVAARFPSRRQVLASAFAAQGRQGSFVTLDQRGRMDLFAELCDLRHYEEKFELAKRVVGAATTARAALQAAKVVLDRDASQEVFDALQTQLEATRLSLSTAQAAARTAATQAAALDAKRGAVAARAREHAVAVERLRAAQDARTRYRFELDRLVQREHDERQRGLREVEAAGAQLAKRRESADAALRDAQRAHGAVVADLDDRIVNNQSLIGRADAIRAAGQRMREANAQLPTLRAAVDRARAAAKAARDRQVVVAAQLAQARLAKANFEHARQQASAMQSVPCGGEGIYADCRFLTLAAMAQRDLPTLQAAADAEEALLDEAEALRKHVDRCDDVVQDCNAAVMGAEATVADRDAMREAALDVAQERIAGYQRARVAAHETLNVAMAAADAAREAARADYQARIDDVNAQLAGRLERIEADRAAHAVQAAEQEAAVQAAAADVERLASAQAELDRIDAALAAARRDEADAATRAARHEATLDLLAERQAELDRQRARLTDVTTRLATVDDALLTWQLLAKAFGRDGLPKLEVDAAGPTVSSLCNDLLAATYGSRFTIEVVTQVAKADGKGLKEHFDVSVFDNEHGGEVRSIADLSGGERVVVEEALRGAIALYVNARNRRPVRTMWRDETTGALDPANVPRYVAMLRRMQQIGGFQHVLFVTHSDDAAAMADAQVRVTDGQASVVLPPYGEAA